MYLLKPADIKKVFNQELFTFHHVSIKTDKKKREKEGEEQFTFHHVSIKTANGNILDGDYMSFTFHHVSIKTGKVFINHC